MRLYLDCDGVLADFAKGAALALGMAVEDHKAQHGKNAYWRVLAKSPDFYAKLDKMADAEALFAAVRHLNPAILTGCPWGGWAEAQKQAWGAQHFPGTPVITCVARDKRNWCQPGDVLVDDTLTHRQLWEDAGGIFIHHTSATDSIAQLKARFPELFAPVAGGGPAAPQRRVAAQAPVGP